MKIKINFKQFVNLFIILLSSLILISCQKKEEPVPEPESVLETDYDGTLVVKFVNTIPPWDETSKNMNVHIDKELGLITIGNGELEYQGEVIYEASKITREGLWEMAPKALLKTEGGIYYVEVDANINVIYDVQKVYGLDDYVWILLNTVYWDGEPNSDLSFVFKDAISGGSTSGVGHEYGAIIWTLTLSPSNGP